MKCYLAEIKREPFLPSWLCARFPRGIGVTYAIHHALKFADKESAQQACDAMEFRGEFTVNPVEHIFN